MAHGHALQQILGLGMALGLVHAFHLQAEGHVVECAEVRKQRKTLEHHGRATGRSGQVGDVAVFQQDVAAGDRLVPGHHAQRGAFAAARRPQQTAVTTAGDAQIDVVNGRLGRSITLGQRDDFDGRRCRGGCRGGHIRPLCIGRASFAYAAIVKLRTKLHRECAQSGSTPGNCAGLVRYICAICRKACSNTSGGCPPEIRCRSLMTMAGTEWMPWLV